MRYPCTSCLHAPGCGQAKGCVYWQRWFLVEWDQLCNDARQIKAESFATQNRTNEYIDYRQYAHSNIFTMAWR
uniref:Uncharacterized protein n=1 Tax=Siphoviridae sp. ctSMg55 TaxID=2825509 RepID=A0A8S5V4Q8_9CAUD|nr:MAG TPA: hypothetical protein [Siphoviridae sp. ctSMg55]